MVTNSGQIVRDRNKGMLFGIEILCVPGYIVEVIDKNQGVYQRIHHLQAISTRL